MSKTAGLLEHIDATREEIARRLEGLTDEEAFWEPARGCWTLRRRADGTVVSDWSMAPDPPPFTTIAWRLAHVGQSLRGHSRRLFGLGDFAFDTVVLPGDAPGLAAFVDEGLDLWRSGAATADAAIFGEVIGLTNHAREHTVEVSVLRDLYRASRPLDDDPVVDAVLRGDDAPLRDTAAAGHVERLAQQRPDLIAKAAQLGRWHVIPSLVDAGFPADSTVGGATALHYAVGAGALATVRLLVEHGADLSRHDDEWGQTPLAWAEYFDHVLEHSDVVDFLRSVESGAPDGACSR